MYTPVVLSQKESKVLINLENVCKAERRIVGDEFSSRVCVKVSTSDGELTVFYDDDADQAWEVLTAAALDFVREPKGANS